MKLSKEKGSDAIRRIQRCQKNSKVSGLFYAFVNAIFFIPGYRRAVKGYSKPKSLFARRNWLILATVLRTHLESAIADRHGGPDGRRLFQPGDTMSPGGGWHETEARGGGGSEGEREIRL